MMDFLTEDRRYIRQWMILHHQWCDCDPAAYHRWNCNLTPAFAQTIRTLDCNPWTVLQKVYDLWFLDPNFVTEEWNNG